MRGDPPLAGLLARARNRDQQAWDTLVERYAPLLWSICSSHQLPGPAAADVSHTVWAQLAGRLHTIRDPAALAGWLATTTRQECAKARRAAPRPPTADQVPGSQNSPGTPAGTAGHQLPTAERQAALREAFTCLAPDDQRLIGMLIADPPVPDATISAELGIPVASIGPARHRCLQQLRRHPALTALINAQADRSLLTANQHADLRISMH
jgi:RNA polymerase sigma factor (sigma-70 family)